MPVLTDSIKVSKNRIAVATDHLLHPHHTEQIIRVKELELWIPLVLFLMLALLIVVKVAYPKRLNQVVSGFFTSRSLNQLQREEYALTNRVTLLLSIIFILNLSVFIYMIHRIPVTKSMTNGGFSFFLLISAMIIGMYTVKIIFAKLCGTLFEAYKPVSEYVFNLFLFNNNLGLFLIPVTFAMAFAKGAYFETYIYIGWGLLCISFLIRLLRSLLGALSHAGFSPFYLFLYLCTFEILPLVVLLKVFIV